ncbi:MAG: MFS transporter [Gluconacetobacter liquefaciens]
MPTMERTLHPDALDDRQDAAAGAPPARSASPLSAMQQMEAALVQIGVTKAHKQVIALILSGCLFDSLEQNTVGIVGPLLRRQWGLTMADIGFLNTLTFASAAAGRLLSGLIGDRHGRRVMLGTNLLLFTAGSLGCALAPDFTALCVFRVIVGFGIGGEVSTAVTMLSEFCSPAFRGTAAGLVNVGAGGIGNFLAPMFGLLVFTLFPGPNGWRFLFASLAIPCLLVVFYRRFMPETPRFLVSAGRIAEANTVLSQFASGSLRTLRGASTPYVTAEPPGHGAGRPAAWHSIFAPPYLSRTLFVSCAILMCYGAQLSVLTLLPTIFMSLGHSYTNSLVDTSITQAGSVVGTLLASFLARSVPRRKVLTAGTLCAVLSVAGILSAAHNADAVMTCAVIFQVFALLLNTSIWVYVPELYPTRSRAFGVAVVLAAGSAAGAIMPTVTGSLFDHHGLGAVLTLVAIMYGACLVCIQFSPETFGRSMEYASLPAQDRP